jgi:hypothetical protein
MRTLAGEFPHVPPAEIAEILIDARRSVDLFGLPRQEELAMAEKIARARLSQRTDDDSPEPRIYPEQHRRRPKPDLSNLITT